MKQYLLIDIGGTFIKYSLADEQARKISGGKVPTPLTNMDDLLAVIEGFAAPLQGQFVGCAISMPGRIDTRNGIAHTGGMLSAFMWEQPFAAQVEARLGVPVTIANDGKCAAAAEALLPAIQAELDWLFERCTVMPAVKPELVHCRYGNDANLIGALKLFFEQNPA